MNKKELKNNEKTLGTTQNIINKTTSKNCSTLISNHQSLTSNHQPLISDHRGITLIALVITIIIMLILVGVTVTVALNGGLFNTTKEAAKGTQFDADRESLLVAVLGSIDRKSKVDYDELEKHLPEGFEIVADGEYQSESGNTFYVDEYGNISTEKGEDAPPTPPSPPEVEGTDVEIGKSYIGNYANLDADPEPEGIIYADLAVGGEGKWGSNNYGEFSWTAETDGLKQYKITGRKSSFGDVEKDVITAVDGSGDKDRFYVMALSDVDATTHYWYKNASGNLNNPEGNTHTELGLGRTNTETIIKNWNLNGTTDSNDMWEIIQKQNTYPTGSTGKWFVPSRAEWAAFGWLVSQPVESNGFGVSASDYNTKFALQEWYWSSSLDIANTAYRSCFSNRLMGIGSTTALSSYVRLSTTF